MPERKNETQKPSPMRRGAVPSEEAPVRKREQASTSGWAAISKRKEELDREKEDREVRPREFWLKSGETANIQFLDKEPFMVDGHSIKDDKGNWRFMPCQLATQRHCLMCADKIYRTTKAAFKLIDFRGSWDKDKKAFKYDVPHEKFVVLSLADAEKVKTIMDKKRCDLTDLVLEVTKTGAGKKTSNNFSLAFDEDDKRIQPVKFTQEYPTIEGIMAPPTDSYLEATGFSAPDND